MGMVVWLVVEVILSAELQGFSFRLAFLFVLSLFFSYVMLKSPIRGSVRSVPRLDSVLAYDCQSVLFISSLHWCKSYFKVTFTPLEYVPTMSKRLHYYAGCS